MAILFIRSPILQKKRVKRDLSLDTEQRMNNRG